MSFLIELKRRNVITVAGAYLALGAAELMLDQLGTGRDWVTAPPERPFGRGVNLQIEVDALAPILNRLAAANVALFLPLETKSYATSGGAVVIVLSLP